MWPKCHGTLRLCDNGAHSECPQHPVRVRPPRFHRCVPHFLSFFLISHSYKHSNTGWTRKDAPRRGSMQWQAPVRSLLEPLPFTSASSFFPYFFLMLCAPQGIRMRCECRTMGFCVTMIMTHTRHRYVVSPFFFSHFSVSLPPLPHFVHRNVGRRVPTMQTAMDSVLFALKRLTSVARSHAQVRFPASLFLISFLLTVFCLARNV